MEVIVGKSAGFCFGVNNAVSKTKEYLERYEKMDCLGELVHNGIVTKSLENMGLRIIDDINMAKNKVIIRAHGVSKDVYDYAKDNNIELIDLTCPKVLLTHNMVMDYSDYFLIYLGKKNHPEAIGTVSFASKYAIIENEDDIKNVIDIINNKQIKNVLVMAQTTFELDLFNIIIKELQDNLNCNMVVKNTICGATKMRQEETEKIAMSVDGMIIIGGKNSSNTKALASVANKYCEAILIEDVNELDLDLVKSWKVVGVMAGASTPRESIDLVVEALNNI